MDNELECMVVADDFTGSCDTGLQFAVAGHRTRVGFDLSATTFAEATVGVIDTETRNCEGPDARRRLHSLSPPLSAIRAATWYKKVDSTVRGPVAAEVVALMDILGLGLCLLAPAYPSSGRTTVGGHQLLNGMPVHRTEMASDPGAPIRQSSRPRAVCRRRCGSASARPPGRGSWCRCYRGSDNPVECR